MRDQRGTCRGQHKRPEPPFARSAQCGLSIGIAERGIGVHVSDQQLPTVVAGDAGLYDLADRLGRAESDLGELFGAAHVRRFH
jgi:hypothetical protein